jgi:hypothetical protein
LQPGLDMREFNIRTVPLRVEKKGDLFCGVLENVSFDLQGILSNTEELLIDQGL